MSMKAWQVEEEYEGYATIVFAETRGRFWVISYQISAT